MNTQIAGVPDLTEAYAEVNGIRLHYVEAGEGPLVLLLHGFPEFWYSWRRQIPALAQAGFHVSCPTCVATTFPIARATGVATTSTSWRRTSPA